LGNANLHRENSRRTKKNPLVQEDPREQNHAGGERFGNTDFEGGVSVGRLERERELLWFYILGGY
jgi:hypothetical protein